MPLPTAGEGSRAQGRRASARPVLELIRGWADSGRRALPFLVSFGCNTDLAEGIPGGPTEREGWERRWDVRLII
jgi:hypothetical protein